MHFATAHLKRIAKETGLASSPDIIPLLDEVAYNAVKAELEKAAIFAKEAGRLTIQSKDLPSEIVKRLE